MCAWYACKCSGSTKSANHGVHGKCSIHQFNQTCKPWYLCQFNSSLPAAPFARMARGSKRETAKAFGRLPGSGNVEELAEALKPWVQSLNFVSYTADRNLQ